ncbi:MAG: hypothetical protein M3Q56_10495 [Bacteroidota bacterium]|nr:hypothetical protein [Bacteroidota bacterium]
MKQFLLLVCFTLSSYLLNSQVVDLNNILKPYLNFIEPIIENSVVTGYFTFSAIDKSDKKNYHYQIKIFDINLQEKHSVDLVKPSRYKLLETGYNGTHFCFSFLDQNAKKLENTLIDSEGKILGSYDILDLKNREMELLRGSSEGENNPYAGSMISVKNKGFVRYIADTEKGWNSRIEMFNNKLEKQWSHMANPTTERDYAFVYPLATSEDRLFSLVTIKDGLLSQRYNANYILMHDIQTGALIKKISNSTAQHEFAPAGINFDPISAHYLIYGEYLAPKDNILKEKSTGIYVMEIDKDGKKVNEGFSSWAKDLSKALDLNEKGKMDNNMTLAVQEIVRTSNNKVFAICEQFKKAADGGAIAANMIFSTSIPMAKAVKGNIVVLEFDNTLKIINSYTFDKDKGSAFLPSGAEFMSTAFVGTYLKSQGEFDYLYTTMSPDDSMFSILYVNYDRDKDSGNNYVVGNIVYNKEQKLVHDKIRLKTKPSAFIALPGKPGYVVIYEYFKKEKKLQLRLEKLKV